jgi:hypothetical protein
VDAKRPDRTGNHLPRQKRNCHCERNFVEAQVDLTGRDGDRALACDLEVERLHPDAKINIRM